MAACLGRAQLVSAAQKPSPGSAVNQVHRDWASHVARRGPFPDLHVGLDDFKAPRPACYVTDNGHWPVVRVHIWGHLIWLWILPPPLLPVAGYVYDFFFYLSLSLSLQQIQTSCDPHVYLCQARFP